MQEKYTSNCPETTPFLVGNACVKCPNADSVFNI
jgi:hypothetical protein